MAMRKVVSMLFKIRAGLPFRGKPANELFHIF
jgi:hypothetical protein